MAGQLEYVPMPASVKTLIETDVVGEIKGRSGKPLFTLNCVM